MQQKREGEGNFDFKFIDLDYILLKRGEAMGEGGGIEGATYWLVVAAASRSNGFFFVHFKFAIHFTSPVVRTAEAALRGSAFCVYVYAQENGS